MAKALFTDTGDGWLRSGTIRFFEALRPLMVPIDSVQEHPENNNNGDDDLVRESVLINGMYRPIQVQASTRFILAGNTTWRVCKEQGAECIPVVLLGVDDIAALKILYVDNASAAQARIDEGLSLSILERIYEYEGSLEGVGATVSEMEVMKAQASIPLDLEQNPYEGWPTISAQVSPETFRDFHDITEDAEDGGNRHRIEYLMRLTGWKGGISEV